MLNPLSKNSVSFSDEERMKVMPDHSGSQFQNDDSLDNLVQLIADSFQVPMAAISLVGEDDIFIQSSVGLSGITQIDRSTSLCSFPFLAGEVTVFENTKAEPALRNNPLVHGETGIVFYASAPLITKEGARVGAVSIADKTERKLTPLERTQLIRFARCVMHGLELKASLQKKTVNLEERELQLKQAYHMAKIGRWEFDVENQFSTWSDELFEIYGVDKSTCGADLFSVYMSMIHPDDRLTLQRRLESSSGPPELVKERLVKPDGRLIYINQYHKSIYNEEGRLVKVVGISQDVSAFVAYEEKLKKNEERFKALVQNSSDMIAILDQGGIITYVSPSSYAISGYEPEELIGRNVFDLLHEADIEELLDELNKVSRNENSGEPTLHRFRTRQGHWIWLESKGMNMINDAHVGGLVINARNVTERVLLEEQLDIEQQNYQRAITSAVIRAQENERSQLSHELHDNVNQVLTTVKLYTEMIGEGIGDEKELVRKAGQLLQHSIDEIRSISKRLAVPTIGEIGLDDSIKELVESINLTNRLEIIYSGQGIEGLQISQELHLAVYRIIQEQLNNIIKYAAASLVFITLRASEGNLILQINDNGSGFNINAKRTGIGITNMQTRAENLQGKFQLNSEKGNGCQLRVQFPLTAGESKAKEGET